MTREQQIESLYECGALSKEERDRFMMELKGAMPMKKKWKVVALRNGVAEAMVFEADWAVVNDRGVLSIEKDTGNHALDVLHIFAPGVWLEAVPLHQSSEDK